MHGPGRRKATPRRSIWLGPPPIKSTAPVATELIRPPSSRACLSGTVTYFLSRRTFRSNNFWACTAPQMRLNEKNWLVSSAPLFPRTAPGENAIDCDDGGPPREAPCRQSATSIGTLHRDVATAAWRFPSAAGLLGRQLPEPALYRIETAARTCLKHATRQDCAA